MTDQSDGDWDALEELWRVQGAQNEALRAGFAALFENPEVKDALRGETVTPQVIDEVTSYYIWSVERGTMDPSQPIPPKDIIWDTLCKLVDHEAHNRPDAGEWIPIVTTAEAAELARVTVEEFLRSQSAANSYPVRQPTGRPAGRRPTGSQDPAVAIALLEQGSGLPIAALRALLHRRGAARMPLARAVAALRVEKLATPPALAAALVCSVSAIERLARK